MRINSELTSQEIKASNLFEILKKRDFLTAEHSLNVACLIKILACDYIYTDMEKDKTFIVGLLHDIGKIKMPDYIFQNHIINTDKEKNIVMQHPIFTKIILENTGFDNDIITAAYQHHERVDGSGYPLGLLGVKENGMSSTARLLSIADSFSALIENRPYRKGQPIKIAVEILMKEKHLYDTYMLVTFINNINKVVHAANQELRWYKQEMLVTSKKYF